MHTTRPGSRLRFLIVAAALALLTALVALVAPVRAQDAFAPFVIAAAVDGSSVVLIYHEALDASSVPATTDYSVSVAGTAAAPSNVSIAGSKVTLTLSSAASSGDTVTVTYTVPTTNPLQDAGGHAAAGLSAQAVTNFTGATTNQPAFASATATRSVAENVATGTNIGAAVTATDADAGDTLSYSLDTYSQTRFGVTSSGQLQTKAALSPDFETTNSYVVTLYVSDGEGPDGTADSNAIDDSVVVTINITNVNDEPDISGSALPEVKENTTTVGTYTVTDDDTSDTHTWSVESDTTIEENEDGALFTISSSGALSFTTAPDYEMPSDVLTDNTYYVRIKVTDNGSPAKSDTHDITVTVEDVNEAPTLTSPTTSITTAENTSATTVLATYTGSDPDGDSLFFSTAGDDSGDLSIGLKSGTNDEFELTFNSSPNYESPADSDTNNVYTVTISVRDNKVNTDANNGGADAAPDDTVTVNVTVTNVDETGTASITGTTTGGSTLTANLTDPDGSISSQTYQWMRADSQTGTFSDITSNGTSSTYTLVAADVGKYLKVKINYTDGHGSGKSDTSDATGQIGAGNSDPTFNDGTSTTRSVAENSSADTNVGTAVAATDSNAGDTLTYSMIDTTSGSGDANAFNIDTSTGQIKTKTGVTLDHETKGSYAVTVRVRDSKDSAGNSDTAIDDTIAVTINVTNVNEAPDIDSGAAAVSVAENTSATFQTYGATDPDTSTTLTWTLEGTDAGDFVITKNSDQDGELRFATAPNFEAPADDGTDNVYNVTVKVSDGSLTDMQAVAVTVTNVNEAPTFNTGHSNMISVAENTAASTDIGSAYTATDPDAGDTLTYWLTGTDASAFSITSAGRIQTSSALNFESKTSYSVTVNVRDSKVNTLGATNGDADTASDATLAVTINVTNVNEAPTFDSGPTSVNFDENQAASTVVATYAASDVDASTTLMWTLEGDDAGDFSLTANSDNTGYELKFSSSPNYEDADDDNTDNDYEVTVKVTDNGIPDNRASSNHLNVTRPVTVSVQDVNDRPVVSGDATENFAEIEFDVASSDLTAADYEIGTYTATDEDDNTVSWDVSGTDAAHFSINSSGVLSFGIRPDFENPADLAEDAMNAGLANNQYKVTVEADDGQSASNSVGAFNVIVTVTNVNETPQVTSGSDSPSFAEIEYDVDSTDLASDALEVETYTARDEETETISWSLAGTDASDFTIGSSSGVLSFNNRPNFEMPTDRVNSVEGHTADDNEYEIIVKARDTANNTRDYPVTVTVTDENERPDINENFDAPQNYMEIEYDSTGTRPDVHTFTAEDYDDGDTFTWSLTGADAGDLDLGANSGVLTFKQVDSLNVGPLPNFEHPQDDDNGNTYSVTIVATDNHAKAEEYAVVITVTNVNEKPQFTGTPDASITLDESDANTTYDGAVIATYTGDDEEGSVTWSLTGTDSGDFDIDSAGAVTFAETPNYEEPEDSDGDNVYNFTVVVRDVASGSTRRTAELPVTVTVSDIEEEGTASIQEGDESPAVDDTVTFIIDDPDGVGTQFDRYDPSWVVQRSSGGSWTTARTASTANESYTYTVQEADSGRQLRVQVTYTDRRGSNKMATSPATDAVTADPRANVPPRLTKTAYLVEEGPAIIDVGMLSASDRDNDPITFALLEQDDHELFELSSSGRLRAVQALDFETKPALAITVTLSDGKDDDGNPDDSVDVTAGISIILGDVEEPGVITFSPEEPEVGVTQTATLTDSDGGISGEMWQWRRSPDGRTNWVNISGAMSSSYTPDEDDEDSYLEARVTYTDRRGSGKSADAVAGVVPSANRRPLFPSTETGQRTVAENTPAGRNIGAPVAAVDPERHALTYTLTGVDAAAFTIVASTGQLRTKDALDFETKPSYSVTVEVHDGRDGAGNTSTTIDDTQDVTITVENVDEPGEVTLSTLTGTIQARVEVTASLEDDDGPTGVTWQWARSPNGSTNWVNIATSASYTPTLEGDAGMFIRATASYSDGHGQNKTALAVSPRVGQPPPVNSPPVFPSTEDGRREVPEDAGAGDPIGDPVAATDVNAGDSAVNDPLAYSLTGTDAASFTIDAGTGQLRLASGVTLDFEGKRTHRITVEVTDGRDQNGDDDSDAIDARINVTVTVTNVNEAPVVTGDAAPSVQENTNAVVATYTGTDPERDTLTWSVDNDRFWVSDRGRLYFSEPPSFEDGATHSVTITATDDDEDGNLSGMLPVTVTVTDVEEPGTVTITPPRGWADVQTQFSAALTDDDGNITNTTWQWARSPNGRSGWVDIGGATSSTYTAGADDADQYLRATASYWDRRGSNKTASAVLGSPIGDVRPGVNAAPEFRDATATRSVEEGTAAGRSVGGRVTATDADTDDVLTYSLIGTDADAFDIDPVTGQLRTKVVLDRDVKDTYTVTVEVHDSFDAAYNPSTSADGTIDVTIDVRAPRPPPPPPPPPTPTTPSTPPPGGGGGGGGGGVPAPAPVISMPIFRDGAQTQRTVSENTQPRGNVGAPVSAQEPAGGPIVYSLSGPDAALFAIDALTGQIRVAPGAVLNYESGRTEYTVEVTARTSNGKTATIKVTILVTDVVLAGAADDYDVNGDETIDLDEVLAAVADYFGGAIDRDEAIAIVILYFQSPVRGMSGGNAS